MVRRTLPHGRAPALLIVLAALLAAAVPLAREATDPDLWWHLRAGELIVQGHHLIDTDPFTFTVAGHHWAMQEWGTEILYHLLHSAGGLPLLIITMTLLAWCGILCLLLRARLRRPRTLPLALGIVLASLAGNQIWGPRTQMVTFTLSCLLLLLVERHLLRGGRAIWWCVPLMVLWTNLHGGFIIGLGFLVLITGAELVALWRQLPGAADWERVRSLGAVSIACLAVTIINPYGLTSLAYPLGTQLSPAQQFFIQEWQSPDFHGVQSWPFALMLLSLAALVVTNRRMALRDALLSITTAAMALHSIRHIALFVAAATPIWIQQADMALERLAWPDALRRLTLEKAPSLLRSTALLAPLSAGLALVAAGAATTRLAHAAFEPEDSRYYAVQFPVCAARWLSRAPAPLRVFNDYGEGGYLVDRLSPRGDRVFIFGDAALMGDALMEEDYNITSVTPDWDMLIRQSGADLVLLSRADGLAQVIDHSDRWSRVYRDDRSIAFVARDVAQGPPLPPPPRFREHDVCTAR